MTEGSLLTDEIKAFIGRESQPGTLEVDKTYIKRLAEGVGDTNPLWLDEKVAADGPYGGIVAPPSIFMTANSAESAGPALLDISVFPTAIIDGGGSWEFYKPVRLGDTLTNVMRVASIVEKERSSGSMLVVSLETTWKNQRNELVGKATNVTMFF